jgi:tight adherence protein C
MEIGLQGGVVILLFAATAFLFTLGVISLVAGARDPARRRLAQMQGEAVVEDGGWAARLTGALGPVGRLLLPGQGAERSRIERLLALAGYRKPSAPTIFFGIKAVLALLLPGIWLAASQLLPKLTTNQVWFFAGCALFVGMVLPNRVLESQVERRQKQLRDAFPDALDLLVICVEAGLGLAAAIERVAQELRFSHPELAQELALVNAEIRAGVEREAALRHLATRTGLPDIRGLVSLLVQTLRFGTSVADTLRIYSEEFRDQRTQRAEENAAKIGTKLIFPLILCMLPSFFVVAVGPAALRIIDVLGK